jgi:hypothetical protein
MQRRIVIVLCIILFVCTIGCNKLFYRGRGDWEINLVNGYRIDHFNASEIKLCKKQNKYLEVVIKNYYVTAYSMKEEYVFLEGIQTAGEYITDQEKEARILSYYALDTTDDCVIGPFDTADELSKALDLSGIDWTPVTDPPDLPNVNY